MGKRIAGTAYIKVDSTQYTLSGSLTVSIDSFEREGLAGLDGVVGYKETPRVPYIEGEFFHTSDLSVEAIAKMTNVTVTAELANGRTYILSNAWTAESREINAADGTVTIKWEGLAGEELSANVA